MTTLLVVLAVIAGIVFDITAVKKGETNGSTIDMALLRFSTLFAKHNNMMLK